MRTCRGLALGERLVTEAVVDVVQERAVPGPELGRGRGAFTAVEPPAADAQPQQLSGFEKSM
jgi:hypothetical protein